MDNASTLVKKVGSFLDSINKININHLEEGTGNLQGAEVVLDEDIPLYPVKIPNYGYYRMERRRIIAFKNPDLILILKTEGGYFSVNTEARLITPKDFQDKHQEFLESIPLYGWTYKGGSKVFNLQELVNKEEEVFERVMANYQLSLEHSTK